MYTILLLAMFFLQASSEPIATVDPEFPMWGDEILVTFNLDPYRNALEKYGHPTDMPEIFKNDKLHVALTTEHQGISRVKRAEMIWDGSRFVARFKVPHECEWGRIYFRTNEQSINYYKFIYPRTLDGDYPPGSQIARMIYFPVNTDNWEAVSKAELARTPDAGWLYMEIWKLRYHILNNITREELLKDIQHVENLKETPDLLRSLAYGYSLAEDQDKAYEILRRLCYAYPESPHAVLALQDQMSLKKASFKEDDETLELMAFVANKVPENRYLWDSSYANFFLKSSSKIELKNLRRICTLWQNESPEDYLSYLTLASILTDRGIFTTEAETLATKAIEYSYQTDIFNPGYYFRRAEAYRIRSKQRAQRGDLDGALSDIRMAQLFVPTGHTDDYDSEAELWRRLGFINKAEKASLEAYRKGSLNAEEILKNIYIARRGTDTGFNEYFISKLTGENPLNITTEEFPEVAEFKTTNISGEIVDSEELGDKITAVNFWFISCSPCRAEIPELNKIAEEYKDKVRFLAFATDPADNLNKFLKDHPFNYEIIPEAGKIAELFGVEGYPTHFVIDGQGRIVWSARGANPDNLKKLKEIIKRLLEKQI